MNLPPTVPEQKNLCHEIQGLLREARRYTYRIALGPHQGRKGSTLQTVPVVASVDDSRSVAKAAGFSLHAEWRVRRTNARS